MKNSLKKCMSCALVLAILTGICIFVPLKASAETSGNYEYIVSTDGTAEITKYKGTGGDVILPNEIDGHTVTAIGSFAFSNIQSIQNVIIPITVTEIKSNAFVFSGLKSVSIPDSVVTIETEAFGSCDNLASILIPSGVTYIGSRAFDDCKNLIEIKVVEDNQHYTSVDGILFNKDKTILIEYPEKKSGETYEIPDTVTTLGEYSMSSLSITSIIIPNSITTIGEYAFCNSLNLKEVEIGNGVTTISSGAFSGCTALVDVIIPSSVLSIGYDAFGYYYVGPNRNKVENFTIHGVNRSAAYNYANENAFDFIRMYKLGDVNNDDKINIIDATLVQKYSLKIKINNFNSDVSDVNNDGKINIVDATLIQKYSLHINIKYPLGQYV